MVENQKMNNMLSRLVDQAGEARVGELIKQESLVNKLVAKSPKLLTLRNDINDSFEMLKKIFSGEFSDYDWKDLAWIVGGFAYLVMPIDAVPDPIPVLGLADDAAALGIAFARAKPLLSMYRSFCSPGLMGVGMRVIHNTGVGDSVSEKIRRANSTTLTIEPPRGTPLLVELAHVLEHSGIYLGNGFVMEVYDDESKGGLIRRVTLKQFLRGDGNVRTGAEIFAACDESNGHPLSSASVADNAIRFKDENPNVAYDMLRSNCHMFTASCVLGRKIYCERNGQEGVMASFLKRVSSKIAALTVQTFSIEKLKKIISQELNSKKPMAWRPVASWNDLI